jgi:surfeit locus 1 family protein
LSALHIKGLRRAGLVWPALLALAGLAVLIGLGTWQMSRKAWKEGLLAQIAERARAEPIALADALRRWHETGDVEYLHVRVAGRFRHDAEAHVFAIDERLGPGFHVYTPLETPNGQLMLVNRGFVPDRLKDAALRPQGQTPGEVLVTGLARRPQPPAWFTPASRPDRNMFYWPDFAGMVSALPGSRQGGPPQRVVPFFLEADVQPANPGGLPKGGVTRLALPNRHLEYALTWYGLALTLVGVFAAFARARLRGL